MKTLEIMTAPDFLPGVRDAGGALPRRPRPHRRAEPQGEGVRGRGIHPGAAARPSRAAPIVAACLARGVLINCTADTVLRLLPPLVITEAEIDQALAIVEEVLCA